MSDKDFVLAGDGWVQVTPCGEFPHVGAGVTQVIDREACERMAAAFAAHKADRGDNFPGLLVDFDHFSLDIGKPSEAAGWITDLEARDDGLWARVRWTDSGLAAVTGGRYRLLSPVFRHPSGTEDLGDGRVRPVYLESVALTNEPNIKGGKPIANRWSDVARAASLAVRRAKAAARRQRSEDGGQRADDGTDDVSRKDAKTQRLEAARAAMMREMAEKRSMRNAQLSTLKGGKG